LHAISLIVAGGFLLSTAGCAKKGPNTGRGGASVIDQTEIRASDADDVLELIQQLRPAWLLMGTRRDPSDPTEEGGPVVLVNDVPPPARPLYSLQFMSLENIREIRLLTRTHAHTRYRVGAPDGAILILTNTRMNPGDTVPPDTGRVQFSSSSSNQWDPLSLTGASEVSHD
jgi:hypothetical protein